MAQFRYSIGDEVIDEMLGEGVVIDNTIYVGVAFPNGGEYGIREDTLTPVFPEEHEIEIGERVQYANPFFTGHEMATVCDINEHSYGVKFDNRWLPDGYYSKDFFTKEGVN
jgi:hypothetical protein